MGRSAVREVLSLSLIAEPFITGGILKATDLCMPITDLRI